MQSACPYCGVILPAMPKRKTKCKDCGNMMFVKYTPDNRTKRLMTESEAAEAEALWAAHSERESLLRDTEMVGLSDMQDREDLQYRARSLAFDESADTHRRKMAALLLCHKFSNTFEERLRWSMLAETMNIMHIAHAFSKYDSSGQIEISKGDPNCATCKKISGKKYSIEGALREMPLPPLDCPKITASAGCHCVWLPVIDKY